MEVSVSSKYTQTKKNKFELKTDENVFGSESIPSFNRYPTFAQAFKALDKKYPWYYMHLESIDEQYKEILRIKLVEHRQKSNFNIEMWGNAKGRFEEVLECTFE